MRLAVSDWSHFEQTGCFLGILQHQIQQGFRSGLPYHRPEFQRYIQQGTIIIRRLLHHFQMSSRFYRSGSS